MKGNFTSAESGLETKYDFTSIEPLSKWHILFVGSEPVLRYPQTANLQSWTKKGRIDIFI
jgi:hypothetical protein